MKWFWVSAAIALLILAGIGAYWMFKKQPTAATPMATAVVDPNLGNVVAELMKQGGAAVVLNGKVVKAQFILPEKSNVGVNTMVTGNDDQTSATISVTINDPEPQLLTKEAYAKIQPGMTYAQAGEALGGVMSKARLGDPFSGTLAIVQGKRRFDLVFKESKVASKSASGLE
jgi:hypothetical protein